METICADLVLPTTKGVSRRIPVEGASLPTVLHREIIASDLPTAATAWHEAETVDGVQRVFVVERMTFRAAHDGWNVTAEGRAWKGYYDSTQLLDDDLEAATVDLGFVGREECDHGWYDRLEDATQHDLGRDCKPGRSETFEVLLQV